MTRLDSRSPGLPAALSVPTLSAWRLRLYGTGSRSLTRLHPCGFTDPVSVSPPAGGASLGTVLGLYRWGAADRAQEVSHPEAGLLGPPGWMWLLCQVTGTSFGRGAEESQEGRASRKVRSDSTPGPLSSISRGVYRTGGPETTPYPRHRGPGWSRQLQHRTQLRACPAHVGTPRVAAGWRGVADPSPCLRPASFPCGGLAG